MSWQLADLPWLAPAPADFRARCKALAGVGEGVVERVAELSRFSLGTNDLFALGQAIGKLERAGISLEPLAAFRLGVLANGTTSLWAPALKASAARHGVNVTIISGEYDQVVQDAVDPASPVNAGGCDAILLALDYRSLPWATTVPGDREAAEQCLEALRTHYRTIHAGLAAAGPVAAIWQTLALPPETLFGHIDRRTPGTRLWLVDRLNEWIAAESASRGDLLLDVAALAGDVGAASWFDPVQWNAHKLPFAQRLVPLYCDHIGRILGTLRGRARKCLVLDLDNTLWGGVIGDDGLEGIRVGQGSAEGEAFLAVQQFALALRARGIVLAAASKNEDATARLPFAQHPDMALRQDDFAAFYASWSEKAGSLQAIARDLNIGLDALVFLDDNPAERAHIRAALPQVAVPELPADPSLYVWTLANAGYFESAGFASEDIGRAADYAANARRASAQAEAHSVEEYLTSLEMVATVGSFDAVGRTRIAQLINKSNQFNLTTQRYTEADVATLEADAGAFTLQVRLRDRFADNGMICCVVCREMDVGGRRAWEIDTWLMSCRVLGRGVEALVLNCIVDAARQAGASTLVGVYRPTAKNEMVREHYARLGFRQTGEDAGITTWELALDDHVARPVQIRTETIAALDRVA